MQNTGQICLHYVVKAAGWQAMTVPFDRLKHLDAELAISGSQEKIKRQGHSPNTPGSLNEGE